MKRKKFNRYFKYTPFFLAFLCVAIFLNAYSMRPARNDEQLQRIDRTRGEFSFAVFGDTRDSRGLFDTLIKKINEEDVLFTLDCGDLVSHGKKEEFAAFLKQAEKIRKPFLVAIGNHDMEGNSSANYTELFGKPYYSFRVGKSYFIVLDVNNKSPVEQQMNWLRRQLRNSQGYKHRFVFMHTPPFDPRVIGNGRYGHCLKDQSLVQTLRSIFDESNITMLFFSHIHGYFKGVWGKSPYIITGGGGAPLAGKHNKENYFYHYIKVKVSNSGVEYEVVGI